MLGTLPVDASSPIQKMTTADGTCILLRPLNAGDGPGLHSLFGSMSPQSVYQRFLTPLRRLEPGAVERLLAVDHRTSDAIAACLADDPARIVGVARFHLSGPGEAEMAVAVGDPWQQRGIGRALMHALAELARTEGVKRFVSPVDPGNTGMLRLARSLAPAMIAKYHDGLLWISVDA